MSSASVQNTRPRNRRPNHMPNNNSNRGGYSNSHRREFADMDNIPQSPPHKSVHDEPRTAAMLCTVLGSRSTVTTKNGHKYKGHTQAFSDLGDVAMVDAILENPDGAVEQHINGIVIPKDSFVVCITNGVDMKGVSSGSSDFTDAGITSRVNGSSQAGMKELQPWQDEDADTTTSLTLDDDRSGGWEPTAMFQTNRMKFNLQSSYNEDMREYTTNLPNPDSEGYEKLSQYATKQAEEIERSDSYRTRAAKEDDDGDEEAKYSSVQRNETGQQGSDGLPENNVKPYVNPALRGADGDLHPMRNGNPSRAGRQIQRQNSPSYQVQNTRQVVNNHYSQAPPLPQRTPRQPQSQSPNHGPPGPHPIPHPHTISQSQLSQAPPQLSRPPQSMPQPTQNSKPSLVSNAPPTQQQSKFTHSQMGQIDTIPPHLHSNQQPSTNRPPISQNHMNGGDGHLADASNSECYGVPSNTPAMAAHLSSSKALNEPLNAAPMDHKSGASHVPMMPESISDSSSPPQGGDKRNGNGRGSEINQDVNRNKNKNKEKELRDFQTNFILNDSGNKSQESSSEATEDNSNKSSSVSSGIASNSEASQLTSIAASSTPDSSIATVKLSDSQVDSEPPKSETPKSTLNPLAAEFKPKTQPTPSVEAPPSASPVRASPQVVQPFGPNMTWVPAGAITYPGRTKATVLGQVGRDLTAQVTGQPLLAHQPFVYMHGQGQSYQVYPRMVAPNSFTAQAGQQGNLDQSSPQPPQVFAVASQQQLVPGPMPAHLTHHHPQPAHGQQMSSHSSGQQPQPAHIPNPAPSPVQHQQQHPHQHQQPQNHGGQPMPHPMSQGPPQSVTPQPAHYPHVNLQPNIQAMPRSSAAQHMGGPGHPSVSLNFPLHYSYPNVSSSQSSFGPAPQPQMSQSNNHPGSGHQPQYVVMPQPQGPNPMQPLNGHPYSTPSIQFQPQNILHGPPQMPPTHGHSHNQGTNFIHPGVQGMPASLQQVSGGHSSVLMSMPYQAQQ